MTNKQAAVDLLYENIAGLNHREHGRLDIVPFQNDSDIARATRKMIAEAAIDLLDDHQLITPDNPNTTPIPIHMLNCTQCGTVLTAVTGRPVNGRSFIEGLARRNPECPHAPLTPEDMRRRIEQAVAEGREW